jgi:hypothetical protein
MTGGRNDKEGNVMNIAKPRKEDLEAVWELVAFLNKMAQGLNPTYQPADPEDEDDFEYLSAAPADTVFEALESLTDDANLPWIMCVLDTLLSENNNIIDQESDVLDFSPKFKQAMKDAERLDFLFDVESVEFSCTYDGRKCCFLPEHDVIGYGNNYREALDDAMKVWEEM